MVGCINKAVLALPLLSLVEVLDREYGFARGTARNVFE